MTIKKNAAFTLIEILVVLGILAFLMYFFGGKIRDLMTGGDVRKTDIKLSNVQQAIMRYKADVGTYPPNLKALYEKPQNVDARKWIGPYLTDPDDVVDAWGVEFEYNVPPSKYGDKYRIYEIISYGANREEGGTGADAERYEGQ
jgi:general secretion pathway protein G